MKEKKFMGDPYLYREWKLLFEANIDCIQRVTDRRKFSKLFHWVTGPAHTEISPCEMISDPTKAYRSALKKLEDTWGIHDAERVKKLLVGK